MSRTVLMETRVAAEAAGMGREDFQGLGWDPQNVGWLMA